MLRAILGAGDAGGSWTMAEGLVGFLTRITSSSLSSSRENTVARVGLGLDGVVVVDVVVVVGLGGAGAPPPPEVKNLRISIFSQLIFGADGLRL